MRMHLPWLGEMHSGKEPEVQFRRRDKPLWIETLTMKYLLSFSLGLAVVSALTCAGSPLVRDCSDLVSEEDLKECSSRMHITFPKSTRALKISKVTGGPDDGIFLKIEFD